jgi:hypothetical protein
LYQENGRKIYQMAIKKPNGHKIYQMGIKYSIARPFKIYPNWDFWFENIPSSNAAGHARKNGKTFNRIENYKFSSNWIGPEC